MSLVIKIFKGIMSDEYQMLTKSMSTPASPPPQKKTCIKLNRIKNFTKKKKV